MDAVPARGVPKLDAIFSIKLVSPAGTLTIIENVLDINVVLSTY